LKIWFLLRYYGLEGLRIRIRNHVQWSSDLAEKIRKTDGFEIASEPVLSLFSFRLKGSDDQQLVDQINDHGHIYVTQTNLDGRRVIRIQVGQFDCTEEDVAEAYNAIVEAAGVLKSAT